MVEQRGRFTVRTTSEQWLHVIRGPPKGFYSCKNCHAELFPCTHGVFPFGRTFDDALAIDANKQIYVQDVTQNWDTWM